jgi:hypothetical protein
MLFGSVSVLVKTDPLPLGESRERLAVLESRVVDHPVESETFSSIQVRKNHSGSGQFRSQNDFEVKLLKKLIKFDSVSTKMLN